MIWLLIIVAVIALLMLLPIGIKADYNNNGPSLVFVVGPVSINIYPRTKAPCRSRKRKKSAAKSNATNSPKANKKGSLSELLTIIDFLLEVLLDLRRKIRVNVLQFNIVLGDNDPCDLSVRYGHTCAIVSGLIPQFERIFIIKKRDIHVSCDYTANTTQVQAHIYFTITVIRLLSIVIYHGIRGLRKYYKIIKELKGGAIL